MNNGSDMEMDEEQNENGDESPLPIVQRTDSSSGNEESFSGSGMYDDSEEAAMSEESVYEEQDENAPIPPIVPRTAPVDIPTKTDLKIRVNRLHVTAEWKWTQGGDDSCGICRMPFEACCVDCVMPGDGCPLVLGACRHPFHIHCIGKWTEAQNTAKPQCPLCRQEWKYQA